MGIVSNILIRQTGPERLEMHFDHDIELDIAGVRLLRPFDPSDEAFSALGPVARAIADILMAGIEGPDEVVFYPLVVAVHYGPFFDFLPIAEALRSRLLAIWPETKITGCTLPEYVSGGIDWVPRYKCWVTHDEALVASHYPDLRPGPQIPSANYVQSL